MGLDSHPIASSPPDHPSLLPTRNPHPSRVPIPPSPRAQPPLCRPTFTTPSSTPFTPRISPLSPITDPIVVHTHTPNLYPLTFLTLPLWLLVTNKARTEGR